METENNTFVPHIDQYNKENEMLSPICRVTSRSSPYVLPIRFLSYTAPYDINVRDNPNERERNNSKFHIFVSCDEPSISVFVG